jgi:predicted amidohydrolase
MRVALGQLDMVWEDKAASLQKVRDMVKAASGQADLILFPEMTLTGCSNHLERVGEDGEDSQTLGWMRQMAMRYRIAIGYGWAALPQEGQCKGTNRFTFLDEQGNILGEYCKMHPFSYGGESECYRGGDRLVHFSFQGRKVSLFICYDLRFPEIFQIASKESDVFLVMANWPAFRREHWTTLLKARAIENQAYVVGVNCVGSRDDLDYSGDSAAFDPMGNCLGTLYGQEGVLICTLEDRAWHLRDKFQVKKDRREDFYAAAYLSREQMTNDKEKEEGDYE